MKICIFRRYFSYEVIRICVLLMIAKPSVLQFIRNDAIERETETEPEVVIIKNHGAVKLKCNQSNQKNSINEIYWQYRKCGYALHLPPCHSLNGVEWKAVMCKNNTKLCDGSTLKLENLRQTDSGYYRCLYKNYMSSQFKIFKIFLLDVQDPDADTIEILDDPKDMDNQTIIINGTALFRCRVRSLVEPLIVWARLAEDDSIVHQNHDFQNKTYEVFKDSKIYKGRNMTYTRKLKLEKCQVNQSGYYYCIAASPTNFTKIKNKRVHLTVLPFPTNFDSAGEESTSVLVVLSSCGIFLLLVILILAIPITYMLKVRPKCILSNMSSSFCKK